MENLSRFNLNDIGSDCLKEILKLLQIRCIDQLTLSARDYFGVEHACTWRIIYRHTSKLGLEKNPNLSMRKAGLAIRKPRLGIEKKSDPKLHSKLQRLD